MSVKWMNLFCLAALAVLVIPSAPAQQAVKSGKGKSAAKAAKKAAGPKAKAWEADPHNNDAWWIQRHEGFVARAKQGGVDLLFLGDSITDGWNGQKALWEKYYAPLKAANFGIGGDRTEHIIWRLTHGELDGIKPKVVMLLIGTNNVYQNTAEDIAKGIRRILDIIHEKSPATKVLLLGVYPRGEKPSDPGTAFGRKRIEELNKIIATYDDGGKTVKYLYFGDKFLAPDGSIPKDLMPDFLHLSRKGYEIWADSVNPVIADLMK